MSDPRLYQIAVLSSLLVYGMGWLDFDISIGRACLLLATVLATQAIGDRVTATPWNWKSALISGLSLCLLCRTNHPELAFLAAVITSASKFLIRFRGKHIFNPTNGGIVAMLLLTNQVWVSPGQWGAAASGGAPTESIHTRIGVPPAHRTGGWAFAVCPKARLSRNRPKTRPGAAAIGQS